MERAKKVDQGKMTQAEADNEAEKWDECHGVISAFCERFALRSFLSVTMSPTRTNTKAHTFSRIQQTLPLVVDSHGVRIGSRTGRKADACSLSKAKVCSIRGRKGTNLITIEKVRK